MNLNQHVRQRLDAAEHAEYTVQINLKITEEHALALEDLAERLQLRSRTAVAKWLLEHAVDDAAAEAGLGVDDA